MSYIDTFNEKIDSFKGHDKYEWLRKQADIALQHRNGYGYSVIASDDFIGRIIAMPVDYIQDWLDGKNKLEWRRQDKLKLSAIRGGFVDLHEQYPDVEIHKIGMGALEFYKGLGFKLLKEQGDCCFVGKIPDKFLGVEFEDKFVSEEWGTTTYYFTAPKEMLEGKYPEAEAMEISVEFLTEQPEARYATVMFSPTKYDAIEECYTDYDWFDVDMPYEDIEKLMSMAEKTLEKRRAGALEERIAEARESLDRDSEIEKDATAKGKADEISR